MILNFNLFNLFESTKGLKFVRQPKKEAAKTETYKVIHQGIEVGLIKWSSRLRGYAFLPLESYQDEVKDFVKDLMNKRRKEKK